MSLGSLGAGINMQGVLSTITTTSARQYVSKAMTASIIQSGRGFTKLAIKMAKECIKTSSKKCRLAVPTLIVGSDNPNAAQHIVDAQTGSGSNLVGGSVLLRYKNRTGNRSWYRNSLECSAVKKQLAMKRHGGGSVECDEFPFFKSAQGGRPNYPGLVSLRYIPKRENRSVGGLYASLVRWSNLRKNKKFLVLAHPSIPFSMVINKRK